MTARLRVATPSAQIGHAEIVSDSAEPSIPPEFVPLTPTARSKMLAHIGRSALRANSVEVVRATSLTQAKFVDRFEASEVTVHLFAPDGTPITAEALDAHRADGGDASVIIIKVPPLAREALPDRALGPGTTTTDLLQFVPASVNDELDAWFTGPNGQVWRRGSPWPAASSPEDQWVRPEPRVLTQIARQHQVVWGNSVGAVIHVEHVYDPKTGERLGTTFDPELSKTRAQYIVISGRLHPDDVDWDSIRFDPNGLGHVRPNPVTPTC